MSQKYYAIVTNLGAAKIANAAALGTKLSITQMAVGDGGGTLPTPNASQTALISEKRRAAINTLSIDPANTSQVIAEQVIPETEGGFWIREMGLFDADGTLIAVCNTPETYKPALLEGSGRTQTVRMILIVNSTDAITLKIDPSVVLATRQYVDDKALEVRQYADSLMDAHLKATNPHPQYAPINSPVLTGTPKTPTAPPGTNNTQMANTAFVQAALAALAGGAPEALDTLKELADALGGDANFSTTVLNKLAGKMDIAKNGADIADVSAFLKNLGLGEAAKRDIGTGANQIPDMNSFAIYGVASVFSAINIAGKKRLMEGNGSGTFSNGVLTFTLPLAFGGDGFTFIATDVGSGVFSIASSPAGANKVTMYAKDGPGNAANGAIAFKYIAVGPV